ncbi:hypothetical protein DIPPA_17483 [Diplonema papillatum]|nr:hypothetical protein DIPPA_17483 [Diplonema papillatum]
MMYMPFMSDVRTSLPSIHAVPFYGSGWAGSPAGSQAKLRNGSPLSPYGGEVQGVVAAAKPGRHRSGGKGGSHGRRHRKGHGSFFDSNAVIVPAIRDDHAKTTKAACAAVAAAVALVQRGGVEWAAASCRAQPDDVLQFDFDIPPLGASDEDDDADELLSNSSSNNHTANNPASHDDILVDLDFLLMPQLLDGEDDGSW